MAKGQQILQLTGLQLSSKVEEQWLWLHVDFLIVVVTLGIHFYYAPDIPGLKNVNFFVDEGK